MKPLSLLVAALAAFTAPLGLAETLDRWPQLPFRQVHLDFHTSGDIPHVGEKFDKAAFQAALKRGHINSITVFAKDHHGWSYHPTKVGRMHPHLKRNLLAEQIAACREIGVRCPIYVSAGVDEIMAMDHPEWVVKNRDGGTYKPLEAGWFKLMRFNSPYLDYLCAQIEEINELFPDNDGFFLDIVAPRLDYSEGALREMRAAGLNPANELEVKQYAETVLKRYFERTNAAARSRNPRNRVFHNSGNISIGARGILGYNSHLELESLPTGGWGWDHFPLTARYAQTTGYDFLGMTGKFHTSWGEFGGFKRPASLQYECAMMLALGAKCSIGDQLHPSGEMNADTYALIGDAYADVERKEPWCSGAEPVARIALVSSTPNEDRIRMHDERRYDDEGAAQMLLELHLPFQVLDQQTGWEGYDVVILPETLRPDAGLVEKVRAHLERGGRLLAAGSSLIDESSQRFVIDAGVRLVGRGDRDPDYLVATEATGTVPVRSPIVIHGKAWNAEPAAGTLVLAARADSYFNRTWEHFSSHQHAPDSGLSRFPGATLDTSRAVAWFAHDIFTRYRLYGQPLYRDFVKAALSQLLPKGLPVTTTLPVAGRTSLMQQKREGRYILHLLYATPAARGDSKDRAMQIIEDFVPVFDVACDVQLPESVRAVRLVPSGEPLRFEREASGRVRFTVPRVLCHQMVEIQYQ